MISLLCSPTRNNNGGNDVLSFRGTLNSDEVDLAIYLATIGPTTRDHMIDTHGVHPHVVAPRPSPEGVAEGIDQFIQSSSSSREITLSS